MEEPADVLADLRRARRRHRTADIDVFEALYRSYLTAIVAGVAVLLLSGITGDKRLDPAAIDRVRTHGPAVVGVVAALAMAIGLRSGGRGGPLVIEAADVRHVLLSPVDRSLALRGPAVRQLRFSAFAGVVVGAVAGLLTLRRLPGTPGYWVACGALTGALTAALAIGVAVLTSGLRVGRALANLASILVLGWAVADLVADTTTSPFTLLGRLAIWPLHFDPLALIAVAVAAAIPFLGLAVVGGTSLEAAERRASLAGQLRFAATLQDIRTVIVLRRQLAQERPRSRPWVRLRRPSPGGPRLPVWRRGWHGILRWPFSRIARLSILGAVAGLSLVGFWRGTTPLVVVAGLALYVAGLDAVEPLSQDVDHPDRLDSYPIDAGPLHLRQLDPFIVVTACVCVVGDAVALAVTRRADLVLPTAGILLLPVAVAVPGAAAMSVIKGPATGAGSANFFLPPEAAGMQTVFRTVWPPALCVITLLPLVTARRLHLQHLPFAGPMVGSETGVALVATLIMAWVRYQEQVHAALEAGMQGATTTGATSG
jgi:hypothetical protein